MRVALVCPYSLSRPGGVQNQVAGLARAYVRRGHSVSVFAPLGDPPDATVAELPAEARVVDSGRPVRVPANGSQAPVSLSPLAARRAIGDLRALRPDVVHVHEPFAPGLPLALALARAGAPEVATFHRSGVSGPYRALRPLTVRLGRRFAACCAVSGAARDTAAAVVDVPVDVLFNGVEWRSAADRDRDRDGDAVGREPRARPAVLFLGRHEPRKGLDVLLEAFGRLAVRGDENRPELWVAGDGPVTEQLRRRWPPSDVVRWLGTITEGEKRRRLAAATVLCAPARGGESFGLVLLEAMAARTVVVASDIPGYREAAGGEAVLVPPDDPARLADALGGVLDGRLAVGDSGAAEERTGDGRARWLDRAQAHAGTYSMDRLAERYEQVFRRVLEGRPPGRS